MQAQKQDRMMKRRICIGSFTLSSTLHDRSFPERCRLFLSSDRIKDVTAEAERRESEP